MKKNSFCVIIQVDMKELPGDRAPAEGAPGPGITASVETLESLLQDQAEHHHSPEFGKVQEPFKSPLE